jgi:signal transduction histidine kinase/PAS domain-containing protein
MNTKKGTGISSLTAFIFISLIVLLSFQSSRPVQAKSGVRLYAEDGALLLMDGQGKYPLGLHLEILEDPGGKLTIKDVASPAFAAKFTPSQTQNPVYGFTDSAYWVRLKLDNETSQTTDWVMTVNFANMHYVDLYTPLPDGGGFSVKQSGTLRPVSGRDIIFPRIAFALIVPTDTHQTYFVRFKNGASMTLGMTLFTMKEYMHQSQQVLSLYGFLFGALCALIAYHIFLLVTLRELSYLYFVLLLFCLIITLLVYDGYIPAYVFPNVSAMPLYVFPVTDIGLYMCIGLFSTTFLEIKKYYPRLYWINIGIIGVGGIMILLVFLTNFGMMARWVTTWSLAVLVVVLVSGFVSWRRGYHPAAIFMFSWLALVVSLVLLEVVRKGILPSSFIVENSFQPAFLIMAVGWSLALVDRINVLKDQSEQAYKSLRNSEQELNQILDGVPVGVAVYGSDEMPKYGNKRLTEILGNPKQGIQPNPKSGRTLAQALDYFSLQIAGTNERYPYDLLPIYRALKGYSSSADDLEANLVDRLVPLEMWASPIFDDAGNVVSAVAAILDIGQRKKTQSELIEYRKHLESMVETRTTELNTANKELQLHVEWLEAVNLVNETVADSTDFAQIYEKVVEIARQVFDVQDAFIAEWDLDGQQLKILAHTCRDHQHADLVDSFTMLPEGVLSPTEVQQDTLAVITQDRLGIMDGTFGKHIQYSALQSIVGIPMQVREQVMGFLGLEICEQERMFSGKEYDLLNIFAIDIAQVILNARLFEQAKLSVALEERNKLARDLHDSVTQALYGINLYADAIQLARQHNKQDVIDSHTQELSKLAREAMAEMRLLIYQLRPPLLAQEGLPAALRSRLDSVEARSGIKPGFETWGAFQLTTTQETELFWISQEILNNILKHAQASEVQVQLIGEAGRFWMIIEDDGEGFDPEVVEQAGGQGLRNIRERAKTINADCIISSTPGQGTKISIEMAL